MFRNSGGESQITFIDCGDDIFEIKFEKELVGNWEILNTATNYSRKLIRKRKIKGPFTETKTFQWEVVGGASEIP